MRAADKVLDLALTEVGYLEKKTNAQLGDKTANAGSGNWTKYARDLDGLGDFFNGKKNGYSWCAVFVLWLFVRSFGADTARAMLGLPKRSLAAGVKYLAQYMKKVGRFSAVGPKPGDLIFFWSKNLTSWAHVGLVERVEGGKVYTVEGNTSNASGVISNGGGVARKSYSLKYQRIAGYGTPDWGIVTAGEEENDDMTGEEIFKKLNEYLDGVVVPDWAREELQEAKDLGITDGSEPCRLIPRFQAAIMALRAVKAARK